MPIGNLGHNPNVSASIPPAPPLPSQTDGARGSQGQPISSSGALGSRLLFTPIRQSVADGVDARSSDVPGLPVNPLRIAASEITLNDGFEVLHDRGALDTLNKAIGSSSFRVETQDDGSHVAIGQKDGVETSVILSEQEFASLQAIDPEGNGRFVFTGARGGAGHSMVTAASDITEARQRIIDKLEPKDSRTSNSGGVNSAETQTSSTSSSTSSSSSTSTLRSDPKLWLSLGSIAAGLIGMAATGIAQAVALTPEPDDPTSTDPDAAASTAEAATKDQLTKEAFQNPDNQKVNIDENGNAIPSGELKDDVVEQIAEQAKAAGEQARQEAIESNSQAQKRYDEQHARRQEELSTSSGAGYGLSGALILGGGIGLGVTTLLHRRNQPVEQTSTTTTTHTTHTAAENKPADNTPASGNSETSGSEELTASRRNSETGSTASATPSDTSSIDTVDNPYADVGRTSRQELPEEHIYDQVAADEPIYADIQRSAGDVTDGRVRLMGNPGAGIQSVYALLSQSGGLQHGLGGLTGSGDSSAANNPNNPNNPPVPGSNRFV